jgi:hypothetical protein
LFSDSARKRHQLCLLLLSDVLWWSYLFPAVSVKIEDGISYFNQLVIIQVNKTDKDEYEIRNCSSLSHGTLRTWPPELVGTSNLQASSANTINEGSNFVSFTP